MDTFIARPAASTANRVEQCPGDDRGTLRDRIGRVLGRIWRQVRTDDRTAFLSNAADPVDLEYRLRLWDVRERADGVLPHREPSD